MSDLLTPTTGKLYACPEDVVVHVQDADTRRVYLTVRGVKGRDLRFSMPSKYEMAVLHGLYLGEYEAKDRCRVQVVAITDERVTPQIMHNAHLVLCRAVLRPKDVLRVELLGETP